MSELNAIATRYESFLQRRTTAVKGVHSVQKTGCHGRNGVWRVTGRESSIWKHLCHDLPVLTFVVSIPYYRSLNFKLTEL